jgi:hypothetical protein
LGDCHAPPPRLPRAEGVLLHWLLWVSDQFCRQSEPVGRGG